MRLWSGHPQEVAQAVNVVDVAVCLSENNGGVGMDTSLWERSRISRCSSMQISGGIDDRWFWFKYSDVRPGRVGKQTGQRGARVRVCQTINNAAAHTDQVYACYARACDSLRILLTLKKRCRREVRWAEYTAP